LKNLFLGLCSFFKSAKIEGRRISGLAAMKPIFAILRDFDGVGQVIASQAHMEECGYQLV
jgi:hypothetical protein